MRKKIYNLYRLTRDDETGHDVCNGFVIRAENEAQARGIASNHAGDEGSVAWQDANYSLCELIGRSIATSEECGVILRDFHAG